MLPEGKGGEGVRTLDSNDAFPTPGPPRIRIRMVGLSGPLRRPIFERMGVLALGGRRVCSSSQS